MLCHEFYHDVSQSEVKNFGSSNGIICYGLKMGELVLPLRTWTLIDLLGEFEGRHSNFPEYDWLTLLMTRELYDTPGRQ